MINQKKRGPGKKPGFRQELRVTTLVEKMFIALKTEYNLKNNSEALHKMAEICSLNESEDYHIEEGLRSLQEHKS